jgi:hypothetical protein
MNAMSQGATVASSISALDAKIRLVAQRIRIIENNEQVMSRTVISQNKKLKEIEATLAAGVGGKVDIDALKKAFKEELKLERSGEPMQPLMVEEYTAAKGGAPSAGFKELKQELSELRKQVEEIKYVLESVNPMEYLTIEDVNDVIERKIAEKMGK